MWPRGRAAFLSPPHNCFLFCSLVSLKVGQQSKTKTNSLSVFLLLEGIQWGICEVYYTGVNKCKQRVLVCVCMPDWPWLGTSRQSAKSSGAKHTSQKESKKFGILGKREAVDQSVLLCARTCGCCQDLRSSTGWREACEMCCINRGQKPILKLFWGVFFRSGWAPWS